MRYMWCGNLRKYSLWERVYIWMSFDPAAYCSRVHIVHLHVFRWYRCHWHFVHEQHSQVHFLQQRELPQRYELSSLEKRLLSIRIPVTESDSDPKPCLHCQGMSVPKRERSFWITVRKH